MGFISRMIAYFVADYTIARGTGQDHKEALRTAQTPVSWGILLFLIIIGLTVGVAAMVENGTITTTPMHKDCKANAEHKVICTYTPIAQ